MDANELDLSAPIVPHTSIGGVMLRQNVSSIETFLWDGFWSDATIRLECRLIPLFQVRYSLGPIDIDVDVHNGTIFSISARPGYRGSYLGIVPGMRLGEAIAAVPSIYLDRQDQVFRVEDVPGLRLHCIDLDNDADPPECAFDSLEIRAISVYAEDLELAAGGYKGQLASRAKRLSR